MKPVEKTIRYDENTVGTFPKISIDHRIQLIDSHGGKDPLRFLPYADNAHNAALAFVAAQKIFERLQPAFDFIEVIKISFRWNKNFVDRSIEIHAGVVIVDPLTDEKGKVDVGQTIGPLDPKTPIDGDDKRVIRKLVADLEKALRVQIETFRASRASVAPVVERFDSLFKSASSDICAFS